MVITKEILDENLNDNGNLDEKLNLNANVNDNG